MNQSKKVIEDIYPVSPIQFGILFETLADPSQKVYLGQWHGLLRGQLDSAAFERAWQIVINRHSVLRSGFDWQRKEEPFQVVLSRADAAFTYKDWTQFEASKQERMIGEFLQRDRQQRFQLLHPPLMRFALLCLAPDSNLFVWTRHHLLVDGWSLAAILREVFSCYTDLSQGRDPHLPEAQPFRKFVAWVRSGDLHRAEAFWRNRLAGFKEPTNVCSDCASQHFRSGAPDMDEVGVSISALNVETLNTFARSERLTLNTIVQGAWGLVLMRHCNCDDVVFGATETVRPPELEGSERMIGPLINTVPVRVSADGGISANKWLVQLQDQTVAARDFLYAPLDRIVAWSDCPKQQRLFESVLIFQNYPLDNTLIPEECGLKLMRSDDHSLPNLPMNLIIEPGAVFRMRMIFDRRYFARAKAISVLHQLRTAIERIVQNPKQSAVSIPILTDHEENLIVNTWNETARSFRDNLPLDEIIAAQAAMVPHRSAVVCGERRLSYFELNTSANRLAHVLNESGIRPEERVGILMERSPDAVIAMLAVQKAGAAFVPLDPATPEQRLAFMLRDAGISSMLSSRSYVLPLAAHPRITVIRTDSDQHRCMPESAPALKRGVDHLAYVIYTSGSTGAPKGVAVTHRNLLATLAAAQEDHYLKPSAHLLSLPLVFDGAVFGIYWPLCNGGTVYLPEAEVEHDLPRLCALIQREQILSAINLPSLYGLLLEAAKPGQLESLRMCHVAGEACPPKLVASHFKKLPQTALFNAYGPTETTVWATAEPLSAADNYATVPIGRPIGNVRAYILDRRLRPVPVGAAGELYLGGPSVARGYIGKPALTAERFLPDPFAAQLGARMYRTGDLARFLNDGRIEFLGRTDTQIKLRGFRIELGEVETVLAAHPKIKRVAVKCLTHRTSGQDYLAAYLETMKTLPNEELRDYAARRLPPYMTPSVFITLAEMPLTAGGKIDRRGLPEPGDTPPTDGAAATTSTQKVLVRIWSEIFGLDEIGIHDNFFELGGSSLTGMRVIARLHAESGVSVPLNSLFAAPTIAALAGIVDNPADTTDASSVTPQIKPRIRRRVKLSSLKR